jgi:hypothetical protein
MTGNYQFFVMNDRDIKFPLIIIISYDTIDAEHMFLVVKESKNRCFYKRTELLHRNEG